MRTMRQEPAQLRGPAGKPAVAIDIDQLADHVQQVAVSRNLRIVPVTPVSTAGSCQLVLLGSDDLSATDFCELAASAGARLLYVQAEFFNAGTDPDLNLWGRTHARQGPAGDMVAQLHRDAQLFNGRIRQLELAFAADCVLHCWAVAADWYSGLVDRAAMLVPRLDQES